MSGRRRSFTPEYRVEAAHRVIDGNRRVAEVAVELNVHENQLHKWVADERRRMAAAAGGLSRSVVRRNSFQPMSGPNWFGFEPRWLTRPRTSPSWKKRRRTLRASI
ncbi:transposase [Mycobacterium avium]|uniref:transposase n=1 Tax=Mycobacterium avium TaxID=1764 RepID=UPI001DF9FAE7|nr:transposase [Mycobacterium avium]MCA2240614.1 transposase [Mycobacterium avium]MCA2260878.1 transposase [Mycobacterium avium]MCA2271451.1 transposase [Mycobacterium avium]MCA2282006.1 transposase [Mycobacterium avium]MCA2291788.1 transposase [Mycobacterium avium]